MIITYPDEITKAAIIKTIDEIKHFFDPSMPEIKIIRSDKLTITIEEDDKSLVDFDTTDKIKELIELNMAF